VGVFLLDVNVLLALAWPTHVHHAAAHRWFAENKRGFAENSAAGWATCPLTQLAFVRLSMQPAVVKVPILFGDVMEAMARSTASAEHRFWPMDYGLAGIRDEIRERIIGHNQLADALLLDLAIRQGGRLATFDRRIAGLLPADSSVHGSVAVVPA
jgi:toxin-antitoxin system PIN domain toxin